MPPARMRSPLARRCCLSRRGGGEGGRPSPLAPPGRAATRVRGSSASLRSFGCSPSDASGAAGSLLPPTSAPFPGRVRWLEGDEDMRKEKKERARLYSEVTKRIIAELEEGRLPWVQPWDRAACGCTMPHNAGTLRRYSGINVLILWAEVVAMGY